MLSSVSPSALAPVRCSLLSSSQWHECVALAAGMAEHPGAIRNTFLNTEYTDRGKYKLKLWDGRAQKWETITVDDYFPVKKGTQTCMFMQPNGSELWAVLMVRLAA